MLRLRPGHYELPRVAYRLSVQRAGKLFPLSVQRASQPHILSLKPISGSSLIGYVCAKTEKGINVPTTTEVNSAELCESAGVQTLMVTDCFGARLWDFTDAEPVFVQGLLSVSKLIIPAAIAFAVLRLFVASRKENHPSRRLSIYSPRNRQRSA